ncbi:MAG: hypothetical protein VW642_12390, partial [Halieaceae bacterium]
MFLSFEIMWLPWVSGVLAPAGNACPISCNSHAKIAIQENRRKITSFQEEDCPQSDLFQQIYD